ncbi:hypothetical protein THRCLA_20400 [Thraustotheca clavata]|uniref:Uncharacterized protein n=1 Tax=Thraustotheca clavata TaxID=74557 RepID=A0A1W0A7W4_9STRA|nr:hypothetical protein THRCLA_20400 [Thraustotheca clavata]
MSALCTPVEFVGHRDVLCPASRLAKKYQRVVSTPVTDTESDCSPFVTMVPLKCMDEKPVLSLAKCGYLTPSPRSMKHPPRQTLRKRALPLRTAPVLPWLDGNEDVEIALKKHRSVYTTKCLNN